MIEKELTIRAHHLDIWKDLLSKYLEYSQGEKPWEVPADHFPETLKFLEQYAKKSVDDDARMRMTFEGHAITNSIMRRNFRYICDLVELSEDSQQKVFWGRNNYFLGVFEAASHDKKNKAFLSADPDGYCGACAVGKHCTKISIQKILRFDNDYKIHHHLRTLLNDRDMNTTVGGKLTEVNNGFYITMELLFNPLLYQFIKQQEEKARFPWK